MGAAYYNTKVSGMAYRNRKIYDAAYDGIKILDHTSSSPNPVDPTPTPEDTYYIVSIRIDGQTTGEVTPATASIKSGGSFTATIVAYDGYVVGTFESNQTFVVTGLGTNRVTVTKQSVTSDMNGTVTFRQSATSDKFRISVSSNNEQYGTVSPTEQLIDRGGSATITVTANEGYVFKEYSGDEPTTVIGVGTSTGTITYNNIDSAKTIIAIFDTDGDTPGPGPLPTLDPGIYIMLTDGTAITKEEWIEGEMEVECYIFNYGDNPFVIAPESYSGRWGASVLMQGFQTAATSAQVSNIGGDGRARTEAAYKINVENNVQLDGMIFKVLEHETAHFPKGGWYIPDGKQGILLFDNWRQLWDVIEATNKQSWSFRSSNSYITCIEKDRYAIWGWFGYEAEGVETVLEEFHWWTKALAENWFNTLIVHDYK